MSRPAASASLGYRRGARRALADLAPIQRHLARQQYYVHTPSPLYVAVGDGALKHYGPNLGYDYGGRLIGAWLDR